MKNWVSLPEITLLVTLIGMVIAEVSYQAEKIRLLVATAITGMGIAALQLLIVSGSDSEAFFGGAFVVDALSIFFKFYFLILGLVTILAAWSSKEVSRTVKSEFYILVVVLTLIGSVMASSSHVFITAIGLLSFNVVSALVAGFSKSSDLSAEAAVKRFVFGTVGAIFFFFAATLLFKQTHDVMLSEMSHHLRDLVIDPKTLIVIFWFLFLALALQFGAFPFYHWVPDVLQGAPSPVSSFVSLGTRSVAAVVAIRMLVLLFARPAASPGQWETILDFDWTHVFTVASGFSMAIGALLAYRQTSAKRLVASLIVAQTGALLLGFTVLNERGFAASLYSLLVELFSVLGLYLMLTLIYSKLRSDRLTLFEGLMKTSPFESIMLILFLMSLVGLPPFPGCVSRFALIGSVVEQGRFSLAVVATLSGALIWVSAIRLALSVTRGFTVSQSASASIELGSMGEVVLQRAVIAFLFLSLLFLTLFADQTMTWVGQAVRPIF